MKTTKGIVESILIAQNYSWIQRKWYKYLYKRNFKKYMKLLK